MATAAELQAQINALLTQLESLNKKPEKKLSKFKRLFFFLLTITIVIYQIYWPLLFLTVVLDIADRYLKLIIVSWPGVVLILFLFFLIRHKDSMDYAIRHGNFRWGDAEFTNSKVAEKQKAEGSNIEKGIGGIGSLIPPTLPISDLVELKKQVEKLSLEKVFERIYSNIFGSQINILNKLIASNGSMSVANAMQIYNDTISRNPSLKNYSFIDYLNFLKNTGLVSFEELPLDSKRIEITIIGKQFYQYLLSEKLDLFKSF